MARMIIEIEYEKSTAMLTEMLGDLVGSFGIKAISVQSITESASSDLLPLGCAHGRYVGQPCPHCMGITQKEATNANRSEQNSK